MIYVLGNLIEFEASILMKANQISFLNLSYQLHFVAERLAGKSCNGYIPHFPSLNQVDILNTCVFSVKIHSFKL